jgi:Putative beta-barrel porin-2, OmpL-like. bbp2
MDANFKPVALGALMLACASVARADTDPAASSDAPAATVVSGYVDASSTHLSGTGLFTSGTPDRVFDTKNGGIAIQQAAVSVAYQPKEGWGGVVNLTAGNDANVIASYGALGGGGNKFDVTQAFVQYATGPVTVIAGKFVTLAGAEVINSPTNPNFSRSILFGYAIPFTHTGVRATYALSDTVSLIAGVNNGWDALKPANSGKTIELGGTYAPSKAFSLAASGYFGKERIAGLVDVGPEGTRSLIDLVATWNVTDALTLVLNYDWAKQSGVTDGISAPMSVQWNGLAAYANYAFTDQWKASVRAEYMNDSDGYRTGVAQRWKEITATLAYLPVKAVEIRVEARADRSDVASFVTDAATIAVASSQNSVAVQTLFKF